MLKYTKLSAFSILGGLENINETIIWNSKGRKEKKKYITNKA